jgi:hypothetical protein
MLHPRGLELSIFMMPIYGDVLIICIYAYKTNYLHKAYRTSRSPCLHMETAGLKGERGTSSIMSTQTKLSKKIHEWVKAMPF